MGKITLLLALLLILPLVSAATYEDTCSIYGICPSLTQTITFNNNTGNVNNSQYLQGYTPSSLNSTFVTPLQVTVNANFIKLNNQTINDGIKFWYNQTYSGSTFNTTYDNFWLSNATIWSAINSAQTTVNTTNTYVPYVGASKAVNLGANNLTVDTNVFHVDINNNRVGIGTTVPAEKLTVTDGNIEITGSYGSETLSETNFATHANWSTTGDFNDTAGNAVYTHSTGVGTLNQLEANFAAPAVGSKRYEFTYTISALTQTGIMDAEVTTAFASVAAALDLTEGTKTISFISAANPGTFSISVTSDTAGDTFTLDDVSLKQVIGGDLIAVEGLITGGGASGIKVLSTGAVGLGTASPTERLHVVGNIFASQRLILPTVGVSTSLSDGRAGIYTTSSSFPAPFGGNGYLILQSRSNSNGAGIVLMTGSGGGTPRLVIQGTGNVGIGTTTPSQKLVVVGNTNLTQNVTIGQRLSIGNGISNLYPLYVKGTNATQIVARFDGNVSASGYLTLTDVYDTTKEVSAVSKLKPSSELIYPNKSINHKAFGYSYSPYQENYVSSYQTVIDTEEICNTEIQEIGLIEGMFTEEETKEVQVCETVETERQIPIYSSRQIEAIDLVKEVAWLREVAYEQQQTINVLDAKLKVLEGK